MTAQQNPVEGAASPVQPEGATGDADSTAVANDATAQTASETTETTPDPQSAAMEVQITDAEAQATTPVYLKTSAKFEVPHDQSPVSYLLASNGLFICRRTRFFDSCVPAREFPKELEEQKPYMKVRYPALDKDAIELVVGFFSLIQKFYDTEAAVLIGWDIMDDTIGIIVPKQKASGGHVDYDMPTDLPPTIQIIGTIHSHVDMSAFASGTDTGDEEHFPGVHLILGKIKNSDDRLDWHAEAVVDGIRFEIDPQWLIANFKNRNEKDVPPEWFDQFEKQGWGSTTKVYSGRSYQSGHGGSYSSGSSSFRESSSTVADSGKARVKAKNRGKDSDRDTAGGK